MIIILLHVLLLSLLLSYITSLKGGYLDVSHLTELKYIYIYH